MIDSYWCCVFRFWNKVLPLLTDLSKLVRMKECEAKVRQSSCLHNLQEEKKSIIKGSLNRLKTIVRSSCSSFIDQAQSERTSFK